MLIKSVAHLRFSVFSAGGDGGGRAAPPPRPAPTTTIQLAFYAKDTAYSYTNKETTIYHMHPFNQTHQLLQASQRRHSLQPTTAKAERGGGGGRARRAAPRWTKRHTTRPSIKKIRERLSRSIGGIVLIDFTKSYILSRKSGFSLASHFELVDSNCKRSVLARRFS